MSDEDNILHFDYNAEEARENESLLVPNDFAIDCGTPIDTCSLITISCDNGTELRLDFSGDKLEIKGDANMNEAAKVFFEECLKPHVDTYMAR